MRGRLLPVLALPVLLVAGGCSSTSTTPADTAAEVISTTPGKATTESTPAPASAQAANEASPGSETTTTTSIPTAMLAQISDDALRDIPYSDVSPRQILDVYLPTTGNGPFPTILGIHGGGFTGRSKNLYSKLGPYYAANGYAFVAMSYRLAPGDSYPAQVEDSFCSLAWVHANAKEYGFDPNQVIVTGGSAGGYLASMVGTVDDPSIYMEDCPNVYPANEAVQGVVVYYGLYDFTNALDDYSAGEINGSLKRFWGAAYEDISTERLAEMSPIAQIDGSEPPFIILHGTADKSVPSVMSERFATVLEQAGVDVELILLPDVVHAFELKPLTGPEMTLALSEIDDFLDRALSRD